MVAVMGERVLENSEIISWESSNSYFVLLFFMTTKYELDEDSQKRFLVPPPWVPHFWIFLWVLQDLTFKVTKKDQK